MLITKSMSKTVLQQASISCSYLIEKLKNKPLSEIDDRHLISEIEYIKFAIDESVKVHEADAVQESETWCCGVEPDSLGYCPVCREHIK